MKILLFVFLSVLIIKPTFAQSLASPTIGKSANLCTFAARQYLSGKNDESLALYQKAISKSESDYGKNARVVGALYYELGVRAFWLSKFNLAEHSFKKAVEINPNCEAAQLMLINLLRFRNHDAEALNHTQQALKKHPDSISLRKNLVLSLQERDPSQATAQAFLVNCVQNGLTDKIPASKPEQQTDSKKADQKDFSTKTKNTKSSGKQENLANKKIKIPAATISQQEQSQMPSKAVYEPINKNIPKPKIVKAKLSVAHKHSNGHSTSAAPAGLVPPPPPDTFGFAAAARSGMKAKANSIKVDHSPAPSQPEQAEEPKKRTMEHPTAESDPDFLIEWASVKKKHPASK